MLFAKHFELMAQIRDHSSGYLMAIPVFVVFPRRADGQSLPFCDPSEMLAYGFHCLEVHQRLIAKGAQIADDIEPRWLGRPSGEGGKGGMDDFDPLFHRL